MDAAGGVIVVAEPQQVAAFIVSNDSINAGETVAGDTRALRVSTDGVRVAVLGHQPDLGPDTSEVRIFERGQAGWVETAALDLPNPDQRPVSVVVDGDRAVVGAGPTTVDPGLWSVYIFERDGNGEWGIVAQIDQAAPNATRSFGESLDLSGNRLVVNDGSSTVRSFDNNSGTWEQSGTVLLDTSGQISLAVLGDVLLVGQQNYSLPSGIEGPKNNIGRADFYSHDGSSWVHVSYVDGNANEGRLGASVALSHDIAIIGEPGGGGIYDVQLVRGTWILNGLYQDLTASPGGRLGTAVALTDNSAVVLAPFDSSPGLGVDPPPSSPVSAEGLIAVATLRSADPARALRVTEPVTQEMREGGKPLAGTITLTRQPRHPVRVEGFTPDSSAGFSVEIEPSNWQRATPFLIYAGDDSIAQGNRSLVIQIVVTSQDPAFDGDYLPVTSGGIDGDGNPQTITVTVTDDDSTAERLLLSVAGAGTLPGVGRYDGADLLAYSPLSGAISMWFDGSDVGLAGNEIDALELGPHPWLLLSLERSAVIPRRFAGGQLLRVEPQDIIAFTPNYLGDETMGSFSLWLDGSTVGLTTAEENVDGIDTGSFGPIVSLAGKGKVPGWGAPGQMLVMTPTSSNCCPEAGTVTSSAPSTH